MHFTWDVTAEYFLGVEAIHIFQEWKNDLYTVRVIQESHHPKSMPAAMIESQVGASNLESNQQTIQLSTSHPTKEQTNQ